MIEEMREAAESLYNPYVKSWKESGGAVIGFPCTFVPEEIIHAAGMLPYRLRGIGTTSLSIGDTYFGPVICSFPKCVLQLAGSGEYGFLDGAIITNGCDSMRRLDECWRKAGEDYTGTLPKFFHYFGVPHKVTDYSIAWYEEEIREFIRSIETAFSVTITDESIAESVRLYNASRALLNRLDDMRSGDTVPITGEDALAVLLAGSSMPRERYNEILNRIVEHLENAPSVHDGRKRLMVVGSANDDLDFFRLIEESGAIVVADSMCFGSRSYVDLTRDEGDPVAALARRYLNHSFCPRMFGYYKERLSFIREKARSAKVDGVILQNIRFCDLHGSENGIFERDLEAEGIPCMRMEREYGPLVETGRVRMRIDAFMERIA
ncbi:MAG TPA: 2-hydroxyacyl-CoA dehydratase family protein [Deltaproteobacteria bacterium]|jgi:benzoyl-CoA reductase/2-hydroxyglutaryl-CoA dehydratase subunit BcrC/BadD/HgdB|nr:2-hydroxyacyl-CoA dehydratase family protein [Deltaproteobacteria bacterium]